MAGQAAVEEAVLDVTAHLLRAHEPPVELRIIDRGAVATGAGRDLPAGLGEKVLGGFFEAALGQPEHQEWRAVRHAAKAHRAAESFKHFSLRLTSTIPNCKTLAPSFMPTAAPLAQSPSR
jgi:hypothetical protein